MLKFGIFVCKLKLAFFIKKDLCFAVFACNKAKVDRIVKHNFESLKMNFKNMVRNLAQFKQFFSEVKLI